jgi:D-glycero-alpha-D-manno-heptose 1-phosphate guanylyltransferase
MIECAILLVGGRGTRLGELTDHTPKPLLAVAGRPFIFHVLDYLISQKVRRVNLASGYLAGKFEHALGSTYRSLSLDYSPEDTPLGTGGAIAQALQRTDAAEVLVLNGDTYFPADVASLAASHAKDQATISLVLREVADVSRYGHMTVDGQRIVSLQEKGGAGPGLINGGIYLVNRAAFLANAPAGAFSLERDLLPIWVARRAAAYTIANAYFIDIGVPADLERAQTELAGNPSRP